MVQKCFQKRSQNCPKSTPKWSKNVSKMVPKLSSNGPKGSQNASKIVHTWSWNNPHLYYLSKHHINKLYPNSLNSPSLISYLHLSFSNLASIKLVLTINLFLHNETIILFHPTYNSPPISPDLVYVKNSLTFTCDIFSHARTLTHLCVTELTQALKTAHKNNRLYRCSPWLLPEFASVALNPALIHQCNPQLCNVTLISDLIPSIELSSNLIPWCNTPL